MAARGVAFCSICLNSREDDAEIRLVALDCGHVFHEPCVAQCAQYGNACPMCRTKIKKPRPIYLGGSEEENVASRAPSDDEVARALRKALEGQDDLRKQLADSEKQREVLAARDDENARRLRALETKATASQRELEVEKKNASVWKDNYHAEVVRAKKSEDAANKERAAASEREGKMKFDLDRLNFRNQRLESAMARSVNISVEAEVRDFVDTIQQEEVQKAYVELYEKWQNAEQRASTLRQEAAANEQTFGRELTVLQQERALLKSQLEATKAESKKRQLQLNEYDAKLYQLQQQQQQQHAGDDDDMPASLSLTPEPSSGWQQPQPQRVGRAPETSQGGFEGLEAASSGRAPDESQQRRLTAGSGGREQPLQHASLDAYPNNQAGYRDVENQGSDDMMAGLGTSPVLGGSSSPLRPGHFSLLQQARPSSFGAAAGGAAGNAGPSFVGKASNQGNNASRLAGAPKTLTSFSHQSKGFASSSGQGARSGKRPMDQPKIDAFFSKQGRR